MDRDDDLDRCDPLIPSAGPEARRARMQLRSSVFLQAADPVLVEDVQGCIFDLNAAAEQVYGWPRDELIGRSVELLIADEYRVQAREARRRCARGEEVADVDWVRVARDGKRLPTMLTLFPVLDDDGTVQAIVSVAKDVSELRRRDAMRRELLRAVEAAEQRERRILSRDLHDSIGQLLALARMRLAALRDRAAGGELEQRVAEIEALLADIDGQARTLMFRVHPTSLEELGLTAAIEQLAESMHSTYGLTIAVRGDGDLPLLDDEVRVALYRCVRELLINVSRHAGTTAARIELARAGEGIAVTVVDEGRGFDATATDEGLGLFGVRDRVDRLGGDCDLESRPGGGTRVRIRLAARAPHRPGPPTGGGGSPEIR
ncbi:MAG: PAS domain S-box protein [Planctomycetota bacterium]